MKIGVLTFHNAYNYGAVLQAYCLQQILIHHGYDVEIIDYRNASIEYRTHPFSIRTFLHNPILYCFRFFNVFLSYKKRSSHFSLFLKEYLILSKKYNKASDLLSSSYDYFIIGSDQVWNPLLTGGIDWVYWGKYCPTNSKVITYAASSGPVEFIEESGAHDEILKWLMNFDFIGVREDRLQKYVSKYGVKAEVVLDPTLMVPASVIDYLVTKRVFSKPYILVYAVSASPYLMSIAELKAEQLGVEIVLVGSVSLSLKLKYRKVVIINASVQELLSLIKFAEFVICVSFHGTALSLAFRKQFISINGGNIERVSTLLGRLGIAERIVESMKDLPTEEIDYKQIIPKLENLRHNSQKLLFNSLSNK